MMRIQRPRAPNPREEAGKFQNFCPPLAAAARPWSSPSRSPSLCAVSEERGRVQDSRPLGLSEGAFSIPVPHALEEVAGPHPSSTGVAARARRRPCGGDPRGVPLVFVLVHRIFRLVDRPRVGFRRGVAGSPQIG
ncbi:hypothetical protein SEVIR_9G133951v4 [Setaria viridis]